MCEMGDLFEYNKQMCSSSSSSLAQPASAPDEISLFLQQILVRSSSAAAAEPTGVRGSNALPDNLRGLYRSQVVGDGILGVDSSGGYLGKNMSGSGLNVPSSSLGVSENENENEEYDCESEEGPEALAEEVPAKSLVGRSSSKRSRAAEVHNLSEKRRRSRINEKMKALQNLIPNSNKTDKASMLDEAIEYLKQLQLQVQMLAMRNGLSLHPMCLPGELQSIQLPQSRMDFGAENLPLHQNMMDTLHFNQETSPHNLFTLPKQPAASNHLPVPNMLDIINSESAFGLDSSIQAHLGVFQLQKSSQEICNEDGVQHQQTNINHSQTNPLEFEMRATATLAFNAQASEIKGSDALETCIAGRDRSSENSLLNAIEQSLLHPSPSHLNSMRIGRSTPNNDIKTERSNV